MGKSKDFIKKNNIILIGSVVLIALSIFGNDIFYVWCLFYILFIKFLVSKNIASRFKKMLKVIIWSVFLVAIVLAVYANRFLPDGPSYPTGDYNCNGNGGACYEEYKEDTRGLDIPSWAKFLKSSSGFLLILGLAFAGVVASQEEDVIKD